MKTTLLTGCILLVAFHPIVAADANLIGFWDFKDGTVGDDVDTVSDTAGHYVSSAAQKTDATNGRTPTFSDYSPGQVFASNGGEVLCERPNSIAFLYKDRTNHQGGYIDIPSLADDLSGRSSYTIEFFIRLDGTFNYHDPNNQWTYISKTPLYVAANGNAYKFIAPASKDTSNGHPTGLSLQTYRTAAIPSTTKASPYTSLVIDSAGNVNSPWHHVAAVFTATNGTIGKLEFFTDHESRGTMPYDNAAGTGLKFRLGTGYLDIANNNVNKSQTEPIHAWISALRVSSDAKDVDGMMNADPFPDISGKETVGFWAFKDGAVDTAASVLTNAVDPTVFPGVASSVGTSGTVPVFKADVPGKFIYSDGIAGPLLAEDPQSLEFSPGTSSGGGRVSLVDAATSLARIDDYTIELFAKTTYTQDYRTLIGWGLGGDRGMKLNMMSGARGKMTLELLNGAGGSISSLSSSYYFAPGNLDDGEWHHFAFVHTSADNRTRLFYDYVPVAVVASTSRVMTFSKPVELGTSAFSAKIQQEAYCGRIACPRITARALDEMEFMSVADQARDPKTVFAWNFDEGKSQVGTTITSAAGYPGRPQDSMPVSSVYGYGANKPSYDTFPNLMLVGWGDDVKGTNAACAYFPGYTDGTDLDSGLRRYAGCEFSFPASSLTANNPTNWTMEAFVKRKYDQSFGHSYGALIFGKYGNATPHASTQKYPKFCWMLTRNQDGRLKVWWTLDDGQPYDVSAANSGSALTEDAYLGDGKWHHVALSYDKPTRTFTLRVDYLVVLTQTLDHDLYDGPFVYNFSRTECTAGFEGWMDEIRFSRVVRDSAELIRMTPLSGLTIFFR